MNKKIFFLEFLLVPALLYLTSCVSSITKRNPYENFKHLNGGMTETEVIRILGKPDGTRGRADSGINHTSFDYNNHSRDLYEIRTLEFADGKLYEVRGLRQEGGFTEQKLYLFDKEINKKVLRAISGVNENQLDNFVERVLLGKLNTFGQIDPAEFKVKQKALMDELTKIAQADERAKSIHVVNDGQSKKNYIKPNTSSVISAASKISYDDAKRKLTQRYINKEITKEEYFQIFKELKASYGK